MVQLAKVVLTPRLQDKTVRSGTLKMVLALVTATLVGWLYDPHHYRDLAVWGLAGAGLAISINKIVRLASVYADWVITMIMRNRRG